MAKLQINYLVGHWCTGWLHVISTPVFIEEEASIEYLMPWQYQQVIDRITVLSYVLHEPLFSIRVTVSTLLNSIHRSCIELLCYPVFYKTFYMCFTLPVGQHCSTISTGQYVSICQCQYEIYSAPITKRTWVHYIVQNYIVTELVSSCYVVLKAKLKQCVFSLLLKAAVSWICLLYTSDAADE